MEAYIQMLKEQNPEFAKYYELLQPMMQKDTESEENVENNPFKVELEDRIKKLERINKKLFQIVENLKEQLEDNMALNDDLAKAIGACIHCFGHDPNCAECHGAGKVGAYVPDFILFNKYINPAVQKFNRHFFNKN
ncbi:hypothetical protein [Flavobacterium sp. U410]